MLFGITTEKSFSECDNKTFFCITKCIELVLDTFEIHPKKVSITTIGSGVDFLGWVHFPKHRVLRTSSKRRMLKKVAGGEEETIQSYLGMLKHGNGFKLKNIIRQSVSDSNSHIPQKKNTLIKRCFSDAQSTGLEPATSRVTGECSNQLSYDCKKT